MEKVLTLNSNLLGTYVVVVLSKQDLRAETSSLVV